MSPSKIASALHIPNTTNCALGEDNMAREIKLTQEGYARQQALLARDRARLEEVAQILGEGMEYDEDESDGGLEETKREKMNLEIHIEELEEILARAVIIDASSHDDTIDLGAVIILHEETSSREMKVRLVSASEASTLSSEIRQISDDSPVGLAIMGKKSGDSVTVQLPGRQMKYKVMSVQY
jgi:transcription elongation factor GreA